MLLKFVRSLFGLSATEQGDFIVVKGLPADFLSSDIQKIWQTGKIGKFMFNRLSGSQMVFHKFFAPDVLYTLEQILLKKRTRTNKRAVERLIETLKSNTWLRRLDEKHEPILNFDNLSRLKVSPLGHQKKFLQAYNTIVPKYNLNGYMLGAAPGSGKTIAGLMLGECLDADQILCCVPKNAVLDVWQKTFDEVYNQPQKSWNSVTGGAPAPKGTRLFAFHYETLPQMLEYAKSREWGKVLIILDESHNFNDIKSQRTQAFVELCEVVKSKNVVWASGTPIKALGKEAVPFLRTVDPYFHGGVIPRFEQIFGKTASRALDILAARIGYMTFTIDKAQIVSNKVETIGVKVKLKNGEEFTLPVIREKMAAFINEQMKYYKKNMTDFVKTYEAGLDTFAKSTKDGKVLAMLKDYRRRADMIRKNYDPVVMKEDVIFCNMFENKYIIPALPSEMKAAFKDARSVYKYYDLKVQGEALGRVLGKERTRCNVEIALASDTMYLDQEWDGSNEISLANIIDFAEKKTVVFTSYVEVVSQLSKHVRALGFSPLEVYGETNKNLPAIVQRFGDNPDANPLIATYQSLSTAVPLVMANTIVTMNFPFRAHEYEQAISRADRIGQDSIVRVWNVTLDTGGVPNISTRSNDIMEWSKEQIAAIMGRKVESGPIAMESFIDSYWGQAALEEIWNEVVSEDLKEDLTGIPPKRKVSTEDGTLSVAVGVRQDPPPMKADMFPSSLSPEEADPKDQPQKSLQVQAARPSTTSYSPSVAIKNEGQSKDLVKRKPLYYSW